MCLPCTKNNWITPVEAPLHKSWRIFKFFILTAVMVAFLVKAWIIFKPLNSHSGWEINFWVVSLLGVVLPPQTYFRNFYSNSGTLSSKTLFVQYVKKADTHRNLGRIILGFYTISCTTLDTYKLVFCVLFFTGESGQSTLLNICL